MIGKVPKAGKGFRGLVNYLLHGSKKGDLASNSTEQASRVAWSATRNLLVDDIEIAPRLMRATAEKSKRVQSPVYHFVIAWHPNEAPTDEYMRQVADTTCDDLGLSEHQMLFIAHRDTAHTHLHIVVNRVHPETGIAWKQSHDFRRIETSLRRQAEAMGIPFVPGRHNTNGYDPAKPRRPSSSESRKSAKSAQIPRSRFSLPKAQQLTADLAPVFRNSRSWLELSQRLQAQGYQLQPKGQGMVITDGVSELKLSSLGKDIRQKSLEARLGQRFQDHLDSHPQEPLASPPTFRDKQAQRLAETTSESYPPAASQPSSGRPVEPPTVQAKPLQDAFAKLRQAQAAVDMAVSLEAAGLASGTNVASAIKDREAAQAEVQRLKPLMEQINDEVAESLRRIGRPELNRPEPPSPTPPPSPRKSKAKSRTRSRSR